ncbi:ABC transporter permease [Virgibacillus ainsalahensis]
MGSFIKKDLLVFWRDRKEILMALVLPIVLILVLNVAFSGLLNNDDEDVNMDVGIMQEDDESEGKEQFEETIREMALPQNEKEMILGQSANIALVSLIRDFLNNPELEEWVNTKELSETEADELVKSGDLDAIIKIPKGFTYDMLSSILLEKESGSALKILADEQSTELTTLQNIVTNYIDSLNLQFALGSEADTAVTEPELPQGGSEIVEGVETYTISQYFTIAISTLFALFMAHTVALKTVTEVRERVFNRILLTNSNPLHFLMGKTVAAFILAWLQMMLIFTLTQLLLDVFPDRSMAFWSGLVLVITAFTLTIAGLSALFTAITLNLKDSNAASGLFTLVIMVLGVLGGSFFPLQALPEIFQKIGEWTPNGLTQTSLIEWIQFGDMNDILFPIIMLIGMFVACMVIGMSIFPKRGRI